MPMPHQSLTIAKDCWAKIRLLQFETASWSLEQTCLITIHCRICWQNCADRVIAHAGMLYVRYEIRCQEASAWSLKRLISHRYMSLLCRSRWTSRRYSQSKFRAQSFFGWLRDWEVRYQISNPPPRTAPKGKIINFEESRKYLCWLARRITMRRHFPPKDSYCRLTFHTDRIGWCYGHGKKDWCVNETVSCQMTKKQERQKACQRDSCRTIWP